LNKFIIRNKIQPDLKVHLAYESSGAISQKYPEQQSTLLKPRPQNTPVPPHEFGIQLA
jgi:hypothetical protein